MRWLKQSTSVDLPIGPFLDNVDGFTEEAALTITQPDIRLKKNGGAWAQKAAAQTLTHEENGYYEVTLDATDTDTLGQLRLAVDESGALPVWEDFMVVPANVWDSLFGADLLQVDLTQVAGSITNVAALATNVDAILIDTADMQPKLGTPAGASLAADVAAVKVQTAAIEVDTAEIGVAGAGLTNIDLPNQTMNITGNLTGNVSGSVGSVTAGVTLAAAAVQAIWDALTSVLTTAGSIGKLIVDNLNATISSRSSHSAADVWASATRTLTAATNITSTGGTTVPQTGDSFARLGAPAGASVSADVAAVDAAITTRATPAQVNAEVLDVLNVDTFAEPTGVPPATTTLQIKLSRVYMTLRNQLTVTAAKKQFFDDAGVAGWEKDLSDDGTTYTETEGNTP
jgi:hypothetical protein